MSIHIFDQEQQFEQFAAGQTVFHAGDDGKTMFAIISGEVDIVIRGQVVETIQAGGVFGEMGLVEDRPRIATAVVRADAKLVRIDQKRFLFLVQQHPFFALQLMTVMAGRLRRMDEKL
jgi:CRP-like cAMP-binding protein